MGKIIYVCVRNGKYPELPKVVREVAAEILPDNIKAVPANVVTKPGIVAGIYNPTRGIRTRNGSVCMGSVEEMDQWDVPISGGTGESTTIFRSDAKHVEIVSDAVGSRTVWYYFDDDMFMASTSQRAIVGVLGDFEFNENVIPWMLSTGSIGPGNGYDRRLWRLNGDSRLILHRAAWGLKIAENPIRFAPAEQSDEQHLSELRSVLATTFATCEYDYDDWVLPLSGGVDSRGILCSLPRKTGLRTISWGTPASQFERDTDAVVAKEVAGKAGLAHAFYPINESESTIPEAFARFVRYGEGRVDHVVAYMDGLETWRKLFDEGVRGIIRGDQGFGWLPVTNQAHARRVLGLTLSSDLANLGPSTELGLPPQILPDEFQQREGESLPAWRDRMYHQFRIPVILAALNDLKLGFMEVSNPLLARSLIGLVRRLPDHLRTDKTLFRQWVTAESPNIPFASAQANAKTKYKLNVEPVREYLREHLSPDLLRSNFSPELADLVLKGLSPAKSGNRSTASPFLKRALNGKASKWFKNHLRTTVAKPRVAPETLAFRVFLIHEMKQILRNDSQLRKQIDARPDRLAM